MTRKKPKPRRYLIDELTALMRKPTAAPLLKPKEAISIALSAMLPGPAILISPDGPLVRLILQALKLSGYKIEPR